MNILIVDDSVDKLGNIARCILKVNNTINISTAQDINETYKILKDSPVDLLVLDLYLPERMTETNINKDGGEEIIKEISRYNTKLKVPKYIVGITQQENVKHQLLNDIWPIIHYRINNDWETKLSMLVKHIDHINNNEASVVIKPTVFVEGKTDECYLKAALDLFYPNINGIIDIRSQSSAGANWVAQQLVIWGHKLAKDENGNLIKCIGLLDNDEAGIKARQDIQSKILSSNQKECCKVVNLGAHYSHSLIDFYSKGIKIQVEIESLFSPEILNYAQEQNWLEIRTQPLLENPNDWQITIKSFNDYVKEKGVGEENMIYLKQIKMAKKASFCKYILDKYSKDMNAFSSIKKVLDEILKKLGVNP